MNKQKLSIEQELERNISFFESDYEIIYYLQKELIASLKELNKEKAAIYRLLEERKEVKHMMYSELKKRNEIMLKRETSKIYRECNVKMDSMKLTIDKMTDIMNKMDK
ncbi:MAG: hypothetical protein HRT66_09045 [Flavobacteriaceae bacterium]|nr:hypothetical protein [Flavobacteriaceae bacterium]